MSSLKKAALGYHYRKKCFIVGTECPDLRQSVVMVISMRRRASQKCPVGLGTTSSTMDEGEKQALQTEDMSLQWSMS